MSESNEKLFPEWHKMEQIDRLPEEEFDHLPFGAIQLDGDGRILRYNRTEGEMANRDPVKVTGKNFFREVAPCTNVQEFAGRFREGFADKNLNAIFPYRFDFEMEPQDVWVRLFYSQQTDSAWVFVSRRGDNEA